MDLEWMLMKDFLRNGNFGSYELYNNLTMSEKAFEVKYTEARCEEEERVQ